MAMRTLLHHGVLEDLLERIELPDDWAVSIVLDYDIGRPWPMLVVRWLAPDSRKKAAPWVEVNVPYFIPDPMRESEDTWFRFVHSCVEKAYVHEFNENFKLDGKPYRDPHPNGR